MTKGRRLGGRIGTRAITEMALATASGLSAAAAYARKRKNKKKPKGHKKKRPRVHSSSSTLVDQANPFSQTMTLTKTKNQDLEISQHNDLSVRNLGTVWVGRTHKRRYKTLAKSYFHDVSNWVIQNIQGQQAVDSLENILTRDIIVGNVTSTRNERQKIAVDLMKMAVTGPNTVYSAFPDPVTEATRKANDRFYVNNVTGTVSMLSMETIPQEVILYFLTPKADTNTNPVTYFENVVLAHNMGKPLAGAATSVINPIGLVGGETYNDVGINPFMFSEFKALWRCLKAVKVILQPGDQHNVKINFKYNRHFQYQQYLNRAEEYLAGVTVFPMVILRGGLVGLRQEEETLAGEVANGRTKVGFVTNFRYNLAALPSARYTVGQFFPGNVQGSTNIIKQIDDIDNVVNLEIL